jgi:hypothetical protein
MFATCDDIPQNTELSTIYFGMAVSNCYSDREDFMISPNGEVFFQNMTTSDENVIIIPDSNVKEIETERFSRCDFLVSIFIRSSVKVLEMRCFQECTFLKSVTFETFSLLKIIKENAFLGCCSLKSICIPAYCELIDSEAFGVHL